MQFLGFFHQSNGKSHEIKKNIIIINSEYDYEMY